MKPKKEPKHGSWLNPVLSLPKRWRGLEFSVVARACPKRRNPVQDALQRNIGA